MKYEKIIVWFRNDLRLHDNVTLNSAIANGAAVIPVYCFDPDHFKMLDKGFKKTGVHRTRFLLQSVDNLKEKFKEIGGDLVILLGKTETTLVDYAISIDANAIFFSEEVAQEEKLVEHTLEQLAWKKGIATQSFWQSTLYHLEDLPFPINQIPETFTNFRKEIEKFCEVRPVVPTLHTINYPKELEGNAIPDLSTLGYAAPAPASQETFSLQGGEDAALNRLKYYLWESDKIQTYKETRNGLLGADYSTKFSAWLALGCLSPRYIHEEIRKYESERKKNASTYWVVFELIWRDFFKFIAKKHGNKIFSMQGIKRNVDKWSENEALFKSWAMGKTGIPFIDANMRELNETGFMSNRGRQLVASYLVNDLGINWTWGAAYFEYQLIDYDVCSNWCNWMYIAGVGNDPRENRYFNILKQASNYDSKGDYVRNWIPELARIPGFEIHQPYALSTKVLKESGVTLGKTYPQPVKRV